ncbi:hypothetical protein KUH03_31020 [Sphingobacterium sp. E70]|uniref:hypothetical protein n=1 Tax=Sphingobacterium sp. E70 TaxID=2853439 RepID=UPI00211CF96E|nr:hypothetical protein [Sphingobacterium sp. E70]ULT23568.1 hypothetical protein KUH03_31020 [Sphingobacterium sp. E70]
MEIKQGRMLCLLFGLFALISCKIYGNKKRDKQQEKEVEWQHLEQHQRQYRFQQDTLSRLWYFWTDSAFRFHADSGLFAQSGSVLWQETGGSSRKEMQDVDIKTIRENKKITSRNAASIKCYLLPIFGLLALPWFCFCFGDGADFVRWSRSSWRGDLRRSLPDLLTAFKETASITVSFFSINNS